MFDDNKPKICIDCKWHYYDDYFHINKNHPSYHKCVHPTLSQNSNLNLISSEKTVKYQNCEYMRYNYKLCGEDGKLFNSNDFNITFISKLKSLFNGN